MIDRAVLSPNEVRALEDLAPYDGGDVRMLPLNMTDIENFSNKEGNK